MFLKMWFSPKEFQHFRKFDERSPKDRPRSVRDREGWVKIAEEGLKLVLRSSKTRKCCKCNRKVMAFWREDGPR